MGKAPTQVLGRRFGAIVIDGILQAALFVGLAFLIGETESDEGNFEIKLEGLSFLLYAAISFLYFWVLESTTGATIGKFLFGIRVRNADGGEPTAGRVLIRNLLRVIDGILGYLVGWIVAMATGKQRRQRVGDLAGRTVVVRSSAVG